MADSEEVPGDYINERKDLHDCFFLVGNMHKERFSSVRLFLANHSPYFRAMLCETNMKEKNSKEEIRIPDHEPDVFRLMLSYVYGCHDVHFKDTYQAVRFYMLADKCLMPKLKEISSEYLANHCMSKVEILEYAVLLGVKKLEPRAIKIVQEETRTVLYSKDFVEFSSDIVLFIVKQETLSVSEVELWKGLMRWAAYKHGNSNGSTLRGIMGGIIEFVRFLVMNPHDFAREVVTASVLTTEESLAVLVAKVTGKDLRLASLSKTRNERYPPSVLVSSTQLSICSTEHQSYHWIKYEYSFRITVHCNQLKLKSITLFQRVSDITVSLSKDGQTLKQISPELVNTDCVISLPTGVFYLYYNQTYTLHLMTRQTENFYCCLVRQQEVCDHCTVTFHNFNTNNSINKYCDKPWCSVSMHDHYSYSVVQQLHFTI